MKKFHLTPVVLSLVLASAAALNAATSDPVGATARVLPAGLHTISAQFVNPILYQGAASSVSGSTINILSGDLSAYNTGDYVLEIKSGAFAGLMSTVASATTTSITVEDVLPALAGDESFCIRAHQKLSDLLASINFGDSFNSVVIYFDSAGNQLQAFNSTATGDWVDENTFLPVDPVIFPGHGVVLFAGVEATLTSYGSVKTGPTLVPYDGGFGLNLLGTLNPVADTAISASGLSSTLVAGQDVVVFLGQDGSELQAYFDGTNWLNLADFSIADAEPITSGGALFVFAADAGYVDIPVVY